MNKSFDPVQIEALEGPLSRTHVKTRKQAGRSLSYIEGWWAIAEANRIFGHDGWDSETVLLQETNRELVTLDSDRGPYKQWRIGYIAKVRISAGGVTREGTGYGSGMGKPESIGDAVEGAIKEAETDARKRALMTFGNPFGLALYDKEQNGVEDDAPKPESKKSEPASPDRVKKAWSWAEEQSAILRKFSDGDSFSAWHDKNLKPIADLKTVAPDAHSRLMEEIDKCMTRFNPLAA